MKKGLIVALIHILLVCTLGAKLLIDRATRPRIWIQTVSYDPDLPIRGRYVALRGRMDTDVPPPPQSDPQNRIWYPAAKVRLEVRDGKLFGVRDENGTVEMSWIRDRTGNWVAITNESSLFFIAEHAKDPSFRRTGEQLWFEATIPKKGPPRPIQLAVSKPDGTFSPLDLN
jgi:hypothetical protein